MTDTAVAQEPKAAPKTDESVGTEPVEPSLDELLTEFDSAGPPEQKQAESPKKADVSDELLDYIRSQQAKETQADISAAVEFVKKSGVKGISDRLIESYLQTEAAGDKRIQEAWNQRQANPEGWSRVLKAVGKKIEGEIEPQPDAQLTNDREAARDAVRGSSTEAPPETKMTNEHLNSLSDAEFKAEMRKHGF